MKRRSLLVATVVALSATSTWAQSIAPLSTDSAQHATLTIDEEWAQVAAEIPGFAGYVLESGGELRLKMATATRDAAKREELERWFGKNIVVDSVEYDFATLFRWKEAALQLLAESRKGIGAPVVWIDIDEVRNRLVVGVDSGGDATQLTRLEASLATLRIPREAIVVERTSGYQQTAGLRDRTRPIAGGNEIVIDIAGSLFCSVGVNAKLGGKTGFVTAAHCGKKTNPLVGVQVQQPHRGGRVGAVASVGPLVSNGCFAGERCKYGDALFVQYDSAASANLGQIAWSTQYLASGDANPTVGGLRRIKAVDSLPSGRVIQYTGRTTGTGKSSASPTTRSCVSFLGDLDGITYLCLNTYTSTQRTRPGDSGGPVYYVNSDGTVNLAGIVHGTLPSTGEAVYTPWSSVVRQLGSLSVN